MGCRQQRKVAGVLVPAVAEIVAAGVVGTVSVLVEVAAGFERQDSLAPLRCHRSPKRNGSSLIVAVPLKLFPMKTTGKKIKK